MKKSNKIKSLDIPFDEFKPTLFDCEADGACSAGEV